MAHQGVWDGQCTQEPQAANFRLTNRAFSGAGDEEVFETEASPPAVAGPPVEENRPAARDPRAHRPPGSQAAGESVVRGVPVQVLLELADGGSLVDGEQFSAGHFREILKDIHADGGAEHSVVRGAGRQPGRS